MATYTIFQCDRPGCEVEGPQRMASADILIRMPPLGDITKTTWTLCNECYKELDHVRVMTDLAFGDKLRKK